MKRSNRNHLRSNLSSRTLRVSEAFILLSIYADNLNTLRFLFHSCEISLSRFFVSDFVLLLWWWLLLLLGCRLLVLLFLTRHTAFFEIWWWKAAILIFLLHAGEKFCNYTQRASFRTASETNIHGCVMWTMCKAQHFVAFTCHWK